MKTATSRGHRLRSGLAKLVLWAGILTCCSVSPVLAREQFFVSPQQGTSVEAPRGSGAGERPLLLEPISPESPPSGLPDPVSPVDEAALTKSASYLTTGPDRADSYLRQIGYDHSGIANDLWRSFTPHAKIETAYVSAETAGKGGGGRMLAMLSKSLALEYESVWQDADLRSYVERPYDGGDHLQFADLGGTAIGDTFGPTADARQAIEAVSKYCDGGQFGPRTVLAEYFQLDELKTAEILRTSRTHTQVLERGFEAMGPARRDVGMSRLISELSWEYESARHEPAFNRWQPSDYASPALSVPLECVEPIERSRFGEIRPPEYWKDGWLPGFNSYDPLRELRAPDYGRAQDYSFRDYKGPETSFEHQSPHGSSRPGFMEGASAHGGRLVAIVALLNGLLALGVPPPVVLGIGMLLLAIWFCGVARSIGNALSRRGATGHGAGK